MDLRTKKWYKRVALATVIMTFCAMWAVLFVIALYNELSSWFQLSKTWSGIAAGIVGILLMVATLFVWSVLVLGIYEKVSKDD